MSEPIEIRILRLRHKLRDRQYQRGGFWPRINIYRHGCKADALPKLKFGVDRTYTRPISIYAQTGTHCAVLCWRFAPKARPRTITWDEDGNKHSIDLPDVEAKGVTALGCWVKRSPLPGTRRWEWVISNMPVTAVTGMSSGYCLTRWGARRAALRALAFWRSYGYPVNRDGAR